jgi:hypothetical protein
LPVAAAPLVTVIQPSLLAAVHAHELVVVTLAVAGPPPAAMLCVVGASVKLQGAENANVFENALRLVPSGPTAATSAT